MKLKDLQDTAPDNALAQAIEKTLKQVAQQDSDLERRRRLLVKMCCEIRKGLNGIIGFGELLAEAKDARERDEYVRSINETGNQAAGVMDDFLEYVELDGQNVKTNVNEFTLKTLLGAIEAIVRPWAETKGLTFTVIDQTDTAKIRTDTDHLWQCILRLAERAVRLTETGGVCMTVKREERQDKEHLRFDIEPLDERGPATEDPNQQMDVGLAIAQRLAEILGGSLLLSGKATFSLTIPTGGASEATPSPDRDGAEEKTAEGMLGTMLTDVLEAYKEIEDNSGAASRGMAQES